MTHWIDTFAETVLSDLMRRRAELRLCELIRKEKWSRDDFEDAVTEILMASPRKSHPAPEPVGPEIRHIEPELTVVAEPETEPSTTEDPPEQKGGIFRDHFETWIYLEPKSRYNMILSTWSTTHGRVWSTVRDAGGLQEAAAAAGIDLDRHLPNAILPSFATPECPAPTYRDAILSYEAILGVSNVRGSWAECVRQINEGSHVVA